MPTTTVQRHPRKKHSGGTTIVKRHPRTLQRKKTITHSSRRENNKFSKWVEDLERTQVWNMTKEKLVNNPPKGFKYKKIDKEASYNSGYDEIWIGDKFFDLSTDLRKHVIYHEKGHEFETKFIHRDHRTGELTPRIFWNISDSGIFGKTSKRGYFDGIWGTHNTDEAVAESYAEYYLNKQEFINSYPKAYKFMDLMLRKSKSSKESLKEVF
jgi:hypothetical protein